MNALLDFDVTYIVYALHSFNMQTEIADLPASESGFRPKHVLRVLLYLDLTLDNKQMSEQYCVTCKY